MSAKMSVTERRLEIIRILEGRRHETIKNLASQLGVSQRTIRYDVEALMVEYPIESVPGNGGGIRLMSGYRTYQGRMTEAVQEELMKLIPTMNKDAGKLFCEHLLAQGSYRNKSRIEEVIDNFYSNANKGKAICSSA